MSVVVGELALPMPMEVSTLPMDPNTPNAVEIVTVDEYDT
jgi:hypothetical protein